MPRDASCLTSTENIYISSLDSVTFFRGGRYSVTLVWPFCSGDLDLDSITLICKRDLYIGILKVYTAHHRKAFTFCVVWRGVSRLIANLQKWLILHPELPSVGAPKFHTRFTPTPVATTATSGREAMTRPVATRCISGPCREQPARITFHPYQQVSAILCHVTITDMKDRVVNATRNVCHVTAAGKCCFTIAVRVLWLVNFIVILLLTEGRRVPTCHVSAVHNFQGRKIWLTVAQLSYITIRACTVKTGVYSMIHDPTINDPITDSVSVMVRLGLGFCCLGRIT